MKRIISILLAIAAIFVSVTAKDLSEDFEVNYRQSLAEVDLRHGGNRQTLDSLVSCLQMMTRADSLFTIKHLKFIGTASPEGSAQYNNYLSKQRAEGFKKYLDGRANGLQKIEYGYEFVGRNWVGLYVLVNEDKYVPARDEVLGYLNTVLGRLFSGEPDDASNLDGLKAIDGGQPYKYMYDNLFPQLRSSILHLEYGFKPYDALEKAASSRYLLQTGCTLPGNELLAIPRSVKTERNFYMALKTNMLYDALALPSIGAEFYLGKNISVVGNWTYGWWDTNSRHRYWRAYGGDVALRWWFGHKAQEKPLTGHHVGVYGGAFTYDFEFGGRGYMGGKPGHSLWDKCLLNCGLEYGYSLPISRRLNIDFTIGIGYISGQYYEYVPQDNHYVWQSTHNLNWFGPTKAEISLVWLLGHGNYNSKKGGLR